MKKITTFLLWALCFTITATPIRVACVGNSITYGAGIVNRDKNSYPAQLGYTLGSEYEVKNFGISSTTLLSNGDFPYITTAKYKESLDYAPQIVLIKLGTNDAKPFNSDKLKDHYKKDYQALIDSYKALPQKPRIILLKPVYCYLTEGDFANADSVYEKQIIPDIEALAYENSLEIIDLYHLFSKKWDPSIMPDKLHPSSLGATQIAQRIADQIKLVGCDYKIAIPATGHFNFHGYNGYEMGSNKIVVPKQTAQGNPWVIRARFWGHEPQVDMALLEKGFHIAYCDVADLYGAPEAIKRYDNFYRQMVKAGLNSKVVLEAMSRGGLIAFNWAARNADKVAAIYADAPVLDIKSWPMGLGKGKGSVADTEKLLKAYNFKSEKQAVNWKRNPINKIKSIAKIPIILVVGDADEVVPPIENSSLFEKQIKGIKVIHKQDIGHHPHSLFNPQEIVNFILQQSGQWHNPCVHAIPGSEYRSGAGWQQGNDWHKVSEEITDILQHKQVDLLLIGNSIIQGFGGTRNLVTGKAGKASIDAWCNSWESAGISGDKTQNVLWRIKNGGYAAANPKAVVITIGVNNINSGDRAEDTAAGIIAVIDEAVKQFPKAKIYTFGLLPVGLNSTDAIRIKHDKIHEILSATTFPAAVIYRNLAADFTEKSGQLIVEEYGQDNLHLSVKGYEKWASILKATLNTAQ